MVDRAKRLLLYPRHMRGGRQCAVVLLALALANQPQPAGAGLQDAQGLDALVPEHGSQGPLGVEAEEGEGRTGNAGAKGKGLDLFDKVSTPSALSFWRPPAATGQILGQPRCTVYAEPTF